MVKFKVTILMYKPGNHFRFYTHILAKKKKNSNGGHALLNKRGKTF